MRFSFGWLTLLVWLPLCAQAQLPDEFYDTPIVTGLDFPTGITFDARGYGYVWEKGGQVLVIDSLGQRLSDPLLDIREEVSDWKDHGLLGFCLDQDFLTNGYVYLLYAVDMHHYQFYGTVDYHPDTTITYAPTFGRVIRYTATAESDFTQTDRASRHILLGHTPADGIPLLNVFHGLGTLIQAVDGTLLVSVGDATSNGSADVGGDSLGTMASAGIAAGIITEDQDVGSYRAQYLGSLNGKVLRIDPETGAGVPSNPFFDPQADRSPRSRTWVLGLRNPYRIALQPNSGSHAATEGRPGTLIIGDVGNGAWEELNLSHAGGENFGWPLYEGARGNWSFQSTYIPANQLAPNPLHGQGNCSPYFSFRDLLGKPGPLGQLPLPNPCQPGVPIPDAVLPMQALQPMLSWSNALWNQPTRAEVPVIDENNNATGLPIVDAAPAVGSEHFDGYSSLAGAFYTGSRFPETYRDRYYHIDYSGWIKIFEFDENRELTAIRRFHDGADKIIHLAYNPYDEYLYYVNIDGEIRQISFGGNPAPRAEIVADTYYGPGPLPVQFDASASYDPNGEAMTYHWDFGDGQTATGEQVSHTFGQAGSVAEAYTVVLTATDASGASGVATALISPNNTPPQVAISSFADGDRYPIDRTTLLTLRANVTDAEHADAELSYAWRILVHHNEHFHPEPIQYDRQGFYLISPLGCEAEENYWYEIELTVTDPLGLASTVVQEIFPDCSGTLAADSRLTATGEATQILLDWERATTRPLLRLELQRSSDFLHFTPIATYEGTALAATDFRFVDASPVRGSNIYRVKFLAEDGGFDFTNLAEANFPPALPWQIAPNPTRRAFRLTLESASAATVFFRLYHPSGQRLLHTQWTGPHEQPFVQDVLLPSLAAGVYFYQIEQAGEVFTGKLVVQ